MIIPALVLRLCTANNKKKLPTQPQTVFFSISTSTTKKLQFSRDILEIKD